MHLRITTPDRLDVSFSARDGASEFVIESVADTIDLRSTTEPADAVDFEQGDGSRPRHTAGSNDRHSVGTIREPSPAPALPPLPKAMRIPALGESVPGDCHWYHDSEIKPWADAALARIQSDAQRIAELEKNIKDLVDDYGTACGESAEWERKAKALEAENARLLSAEQEHEAEVTLFNHGFEIAKAGKPVSEADDVSEFAAIGWAWFHHLPNGRAAERRDEAAPEWSHEVPDNGGRYYWMRNVDGGEEQDRWIVELCNDYMYGDPQYFHTMGDKEHTPLSILNEKHIEICSTPIEEPDSPRAPVSSERRDEAGT